MQRGRTIDSSLKAIEAVLLGEFERTRYSKVFCFL